MENPNDEIRNPNQSTNDEIRDDDRPIVNLFSRIQCRKLRVGDNPALPCGVEYRSKFQVSRVVLDPVFLSRHAIGKGLFDETPRVPHHLGHLRNPPPRRPPQNRRSQHNQYGDPVLGYDEHRWDREKSLLKFPPILFTRPQMQPLNRCYPRSVNEVDGPTTPVRVDPTMFTKFSRQRMIPIPSVVSSRDG